MSDDEVGTEHQIELISDVEEAVPEAAEEPSGFPVEALPGCVKNFVQDIAASIQVPVDLPGSLAVGVLAAATARKYRVQIGDTHQEPLSLELMCALGSGIRKGPTFAAVVDPLSAFENDLPQIKDSLFKQIMDVQNAREEAQSDEERLRCDYAFHDLTRLDYILGMPNRYLTSDVTAEGMALLLQENGGRMAVIDPDGGRRRRDPSRALLVEGGKGQHRGLAEGLLRGGPPDR
jgi:hypothetical protein